MKKRVELLQNEFLKEIESENFKYGKILDNVLRFMK